MFTLLQALDQSIASDHSWIKERWRSVKSRFKATQSPF